MKNIIFEHIDKTIEIIVPTASALSRFTMLKIGEKSTPLDLPFWIVDESVIPSDYLMRNAWRLDGTQGTPDGYGEKI